MLRPLPPRPSAAALESDDSASLGGLADVLEPDLDLDDAVTSLRQLSAASVQSLRNLGIR